ncbi:hypothetical protein Tco_1058375 [Tanacetum coccineum]|uniref:Uncharacterized protein n=1 Tax=Tanacetum coccineum TaxID=301880 RepID=A0ABQ5H846_9ASTR
MAINKGIQEVLAASIEHGKAGWYLDQVEVYDFGVEAEYVATANKFDNLSFSLLEELEALKDSPLELIMSFLNLEGGHGDKDPSPDFIARPMAKRRKAFASSSLAVGGVSATVPSPDSTLAVADYQISSLVIADGAVPSFEPHDDLFDSTILDKPVDS